jgi:hypothetical protein
VSVQPEPQSTNGAGKRDDKGRFRKGFSGNPGGQPKGVAQEARRLSGTDGKKYLKILDKIACDPSEKTGDRIRALELALERGYGKAPAYAPIEGEDPLELEAIDRSVAGVMDELAARREAEAPERATVGEMEAGPQAGANPTSG